MMKPLVIKPQISSGQLAFLMMANRIAVMTMFLPIAGLQDSWLSAIIAGGGGLAITWLAVSLSRLAPMQSLVQMCICAMGKWLGGGAACLFLWFFLHIETIVLRQFAEILHEALMPETPHQVFLILVTLAAIFAVSRGLEAIVRTNAIMLTVTLVFMSLIFFLLMGEFKLERLPPFFQDPLELIVLNSVVPLAWFGEVILLTMLYPYVSNKEKVMKHSMLAIIVSTIMLIMLTFYINSIFGVDEAQDLTLPVFSMVRMISLAQFFERIEAVMVAVWISLLYVKISIFLYAGVIGVGQLLRLASFRFLIMPLAVFSLLLAELSFEGNPELRHFLTAKHWGFYALAMEITLPVLLLFLMFLRQRREAG